MGLIRRTQYARVRVGIEYVRVLRTSTRSYSTVESGRTELFRLFTRLKLLRARKPRKACLLFKTFLWKHTEWPSLGT